MADDLSIVVLPGDGIGPEVTAQSVRVLEAVCAKMDLPLRLLQYDAGAAYYQMSGRQCEAKVFRAAEKADAVLFGAVGLPGVRMSDGRLAGADVLFGLRGGLDLYANVRPVKLLPGVHHMVSGKKKVVWPAADIVIVRENTEGLYASPGASLEVPVRSATDRRRITRRGSRRVIQEAFEIASRRAQDTAGKGKVTCVDKSNLLLGCVLFHDEFRHVAADYPGVRTDHLHIDAATLALLRDPEKYDVLVTTNLFGDILSDMASFLGGGLGTMPSANIGKEHGMFEPVHGSAPDIAGKDLANPLGSIRSVVLMLEWLARRKNDWRLMLAGSMIEKACADVTSAGIMTPDIGGKSSCSEVGSAVLRSLERQTMRRNER